MAKKLERILNSTKPLSILALRLGGIGDVVTLVPALRALRERFPDAAITLCAEKGSIQLVEHSGLCDEFLVFDELYRCQSYLEFLNPIHWKKIAGFLKELRKHHYDLFLNFHDVYHISSLFKPLLVSWASGAPCKVGLDTGGYGFFLDQKIPTDRFAFEHMLDRYLRVVKALGVQNPSRKTQVWLTEEDRRFADEVFKQEALRGAPQVVCMHLGANPAIPQNYWPIENFIQVAKYLASSYHAKILVVGASTDESLSAAMRVALGDSVLDMTGKTSVRECAALIERANLLVGVDSGPMHVGIAVGTPTVGIFTPGNYHAFGTYGGEFTHYYPVWHPVKNLILTKHTKLKGNPFRDWISVEEVTAACEKLLCMPKEKAKLSVSIVAGREAANLRKCLETLAPALLGIDFELMVTDNVVGWDVESLTKSFFSKAIVIRNPTAQGFGANHNRALLGREDQYALILNDDIELAPAAIRNLLCFAEEHPRGAVFGPCLYSASWHAIPTASGSYRKPWLPRSIHGSLILLLYFLIGRKNIARLVAKYHDRYVEDRPLTYVSGACCLVRRNFIREHGLFDEKFYMYFEDIDLGRRAEAAGAECWMAASSKVMHREGGSFSNKTWGWFLESALYFSEKYEGCWTSLAMRILAWIFKMIYQMPIFFKGKTGPV